MPTMTIYENETLSVNVFPQSKNIWIERWSEDGKKCIGEVTLTEKEIDELFAEYLYYRQELKEPAKDGE